MGTYSEPIGQQYKPAPNKAVLFGRFEKNHLTHFALVLENASRTREYRVQFDSSSDVAAIEVEPDVYQITELLAANVIHDPIGKIALTGWPYRVPFTVQPGGAYYLGNFTGVFSSLPITPQFRAEPNAIYRMNDSPGGMSWLTWKLEPAIDGFDSAQSELLKTYPMLQAVLVRRAFPQRSPSGSTTLAPDSQRRSGEAPFSGVTGDREFWRKNTP